MTFVRKICTLNVDEIDGWTSHVEIIESNYKPIYLALLKPKMTNVNNYTKWGNGMERITLKEISGNS